MELNGFTISLYDTAWATSPSFYDFVITRGIASGLPDNIGPDFSDPNAAFVQMGNAAAMRMVHDPKYGAAMLYAEWPATQKAPVVEVTSRFATRDRAVDFSNPGPVTPLAAADRDVAGTHGPPVHGCSPDPGRRAHRVVARTR